MELAELHANDLRAQTTDQRSLQATDAYYGEIHLLLGEKNTPEAQRLREKIVEWRRQALSLAEARYTQGLSNYMAVHLARLAMLPHEAKDSFAGAIRRLEEEQEKIFTAQRSGGILSQAEELKLRRQLLLQKLFSRHTDSAQLPELINRVEANFSAAQKQARTRYNQGLAPYAEIQCLQDEEYLFEACLLILKPGVIPPPHDQHLVVERFLQQYNTLAGDKEANPATLLKARLNYLIVKHAADLSKPSCS